MAHIGKCLSAFYKYYLAVTVGFCETPSCSSRGTDWMGYMKYLRTYTRKMAPDQFYTISNVAFPSSFSMIFFHNQLWVSASRSSPRRIVCLKYTFLGLHQRIIRKRCFCYYDNNIKLDQSVNQLVFLWGFLADWSRRVGNPSAFVNEMAVFLHTFTSLRITVTSWSWITIVWRQVASHYEICAIALWIKMVVQTVTHSVYEWTLGCCSWPPNMEINCKYPSSKDVEVCFLTYKNEDTYSILWFYFNFVSKRQLQWVS